MASAKITAIGESTLSGSVGAADVTWVVASGTSFPTAGDFWVKCENEIAKATARSGASLTVVRAQDGTTAAVHPNGASVIEVVGPAFYDQFKADISGSGTDAAKPAAEKAGNQYWANDGLYHYRDTGAALVPWGPIWPLTAPVSGDFAWINQGTATVDTTRGATILTSVATAGDNLRIRKKTAPATPYTITAAFIPTVAQAVGSECGIGFRESSTGRVAIMRYIFNSAGQVNISKYNSPTSPNSDYATFANMHANLLGGLIFFRIADNGTNRICSFSNNGYTFVQLHSVGRTDFLTADEVLFYAESENATYDCVMTLLSWVQA